MKRFTAIILGSAMLVAACGNESQSPTGATATSSASPSETTTTQFSAAVTFSASSTTTAPAPLTTEAVPVATTDASSPPTTLVTTTSSPTPSPVDTVVAILGGYIVVADAETGDVGFSSLVADVGSWAVDLNVNSTGDRAYFTLWFEDWWYSCEASTGTIYSIDLDGGGGYFEFGRGRRWVGSADGVGQAFITSNSCMPDPEEPDLWVIVRFDTVVLVEPMSGEDFRIPVGLGAEVEVVDITYAPDGDLFVLLSNAEIRKVNFDHFVLADAPVYGFYDLGGEPSSWSLVGFEQNLGGLLVSKTEVGLSSVAVVIEHGPTEIIREDVVAMNYRLAGGSFMQLVLGQLFVDGHEVLIPAQDELGESFVNDVAWVEALG